MPQRQRKIPTEQLYTERISRRSIHGDDLARGVQENDRVRELIQ